MANSPFDETRQIFPVDHEFPITAEYPAVQVPPAHRGLSPSIKIAVAVLGVIALVILGLLAANIAINAGSNDVAAPAPATPVAEVAAPVAPTAAATAAPDIEPELSALWRVIDVPDQLNVRALPGTTHDVVATLPSTARGVISTGQRALVNGAEWKQIIVGDTSGWVSARFLALDNGDLAEDADSAVCFRSASGQPQFARIVFSDRTTFTGQIRLAAQGVDRVSGVISNGTATVAVVDTSSGTTRLQTWQFDIATVRIDDDILLEIVACNDIDGIFA